MRIGAKTALLIVNTGSPEESTPEAVAPYLQEFLSDRSIVSLPTWVWQPILRGIIIPRRRYASAERYRRVWTEAGSPLFKCTQEIAKGLQGFLGEDWIVDVAMRYGRPALRDRLLKLVQQDVESIYLMPLFAQSASQTSGTIVKAAQEVLFSVSRQSVLHIVSPWFEAIGYIRALSQSVLESLRDLQNTHLVMSFHGVPEKGAEEYRRHVGITAECLAKDLGLSPSQYSLTFQSKFGFGKWLEPSTVATVEHLAKSGCRNVAVVCPGFAVDCLETLEEIEVDLQQRFLQAGGTNFQYVPCLNARDEILHFYRDWVLKGVLENADECPHIN